jgi:esterase FrsA
VAFEWQLDPADLFRERYEQMVSQGIPRDDADAVGSAITAMWPDQPGGWAHEWSTLADRYAQRGEHAVAAQAFGWAHFPSLANDSKRRALRRQLNEYLLAAPTFDLDFERIVLDVAYDGKTVPLPVHLLGSAALPADAPVILISGGVDSWKMDLHGMIRALATSLPVRMLAFDIPGTGENPIPMSRPSTRIIDLIVAAAREMTHGPVLHVGISMGGYFSSYSGLSGLVDAAVSFGGPVDAAFDRNRRWQHGMAGIVGNALGLDHEPTPEALSLEVSALSLHDLVVTETGTTPILAINGADDVHMPQHDTLLFADRPGCTANLIPGAGHVAGGKRPEALRAIVHWLGERVDSMST